jgi:subtilase family serine protease
LRACANGKDPKIPESNTGNNCRQATGTITVADVPNLLVVGITEPPSSKPQGQSFPATFIVKNKGAVPAAPSLVKFYLMFGTTRQDLKAAVADVTVGTVGPGLTFTHTLTLTVRVETVPGTYLLQVCADSGKTVTENNENDNCKNSVGTVQVTPQPDLFVKRVTVIGAPLTVEQGESFPVQVVVRNGGLLDAPASTLKFRLLSTGVTPLQQGMTTLAVPAGSAGTQVTLDATPVVDDEAVPGSYVVQACADYGNTFGESSEGNNCLAGVGTVTVLGLPLSPADLTVTALTPPPAPRLPGEPFTLTATVQNHRTDASPSTTSKFYLVPTAGTVTPRKNLKGVQILGPLAAGATNATPVTVEAYSDTVPGSYFLEACADGEKLLHESNENDNYFRLTTALTVLQAPDLVVTQVGDPLVATILPGRPWR